MLRALTWCCLYILLTEKHRSRNDFLGKENEGEALRSFGVNSDGYVGFFNPESLLIN